MFAFIVLGAAFSYFGHSITAVITMTMAGIAVIGYIELLANPEGGLAEFLDIRKKSASPIYSIHS